MIENADKSITIAPSATQKALGEVTYTIRYAITVFDKSTSGKFTAISETQVTYVDYCESSQVSIEPTQPVNAMTTSVLRPVSLPGTYDLQ